MVYKAKSVFYEGNSLSFSTNKSIENKEMELLEIIKANEIFINDIYLANLRIITTKILIRNFQKKAKNRKKRIFETKAVRAAATIRKLKIKKPKVTVPPRVE